MAIAEQKIPLVWRPYQDPLCDTCNEKIEHIARVIILQDHDLEPYVMFTHYFFPCWDFNLLCKKYPHLCIDKLGFSIPQKIQITEKTKFQIKYNLGFWV